MSGLRSDAFEIPHRRSAPEPFVLGAELCDAAGMLTLSDEAASLIRTLTRNAEADGSCGLRITVDGRHDSLSMALAAGASPGDSVVLNDETLVFLSPAASLRLSGSTLRAGRSAFFVT